MAASLLRLGRLGSFKGLQVNSWISPKKRPTLWFCTQANKPKKPVKKTKAVGKTEAPDERATLLAHRTAVSFPVRLSKPGGFLLGGTENSVTAAPVGEAASRAVEPLVPLADIDGKSSTPEEAPGSTGAENATTASFEPNDTAADKLSSSSSSSSSSDSDSDSDSDSEDKLEGEAKIRNGPPEFAVATSGVSKGITEVEVKHEAAGADQHPGTGPQDRTEEAEKFSPETGSEAPADVREDAAASYINEAHNKTPLLQVAQAGALAGVSKESQRNSTKPLESKSGPLEATAGAETLSPAEDLKDPVLVSTEATGEGLPVETAAEQLEEPTAAAEPPESEEPFDNSTYKNCQHHSYTPYTFVDLDVDMAKYRLPQPSSGRPSPRH